MSERFHYGKAKTYYTILLTAGSRDAQANPTLAIGDVKISKDGGTFNNITTLPTVSPASGTQVKITLTASECQAKHIMIRFVDQTATAQWEEQTIVLELEDPRQGKNALITTSLVDRTGPNSGVITRSGYPDYVAIFTSDSSGGSNELKLGPALIGAIVYHPSSGKHAIILGGYWFNDTSNLAYEPFGIATDTRFNIRDGASTTINSNWSGTDLNEDTHGNGWTFICASTTSAGIDHSGEALEIWVDSGNITEHDVSDKSTLSLRHMKIYNDLGNGEYGIDIYADLAARFWADAGNAVDITTDDSVSHGLAIFGGASGRSLYAKEIGSVLASVDGLTNVSILQILAKILDDNGGADFDATTDSLEKISDAIAVGGTVDANLVSIDGVTLLSGNAILPLKQLSLISADATVPFVIESDNASTPAWTIHAKGSTSNAIEITSDDRYTLNLSGSTANIILYTSADDANNIFFEMGGSDNCRAINISGTSPFATNMRGIDIYLPDSTSTPIKVEGGNNAVSLTGLVNGLFTSGGTNDIKAAELDAIVNKLPAGTISDLSLSSVVDGVTLSDIYEIIMAFTNGRFAVNTPSTGNITFYKRDNVTVLYIVNVTTLGRTRL